jgi:alanine racemase
MMDPFDLRLWDGHKEAGLDSAHPHIVDQITIDARRLYGKHSLFVALKGSKADGHQYLSQAAASGAKYALVRKDWVGDCEGLKLLKVNNPLKAFQDIAKTYRKQMKCQVIAITGSYGKTMVKDLLHAFLETTHKTAASPESFNSQIGVPLSLLTIKKDDKFALIEAAISEIGEMDILADIISPDFAILTHIGKKHLATLGNLETTTMEMVKLLRKIPEQNWALIPDDPILNNHTLIIPAQKLSWSDISPPYAKLMPFETYTIRFPDGIVHHGKIPFGYSYFIDLLNLTIKPAWKLGIAASDIRKILERYTPEPMRTEIWRSPDGANFINDSYCSGPQSIDISLKYFEQFPRSKRKIFLFGGMKGEDRHDSDYQRIGEAIEKSGLDKVILIGNKPFQSLIDTLKSVKVENQPSEESAFEHLKTEITTEDTILIKGDKKQPLDTLTAAFNDSICTNQCFINLAAIQANLNAIRQKVCDHTRIMVMVKAEAYGMNDLRLTAFLKACGIDIFGVSYVDEGVALRTSGIQDNIFVLNTAPYETLKVVKWDLEVGVHDKSIITELAKESAKSNKIVKVHLHVDTGMSRLGCRPEEALPLAKMIQSLPSLKLEGILTHLACADDPNEDPFTFKQIEVFDKTIKEIEDNGITIHWKHACNSSATLRFDFPQYNMVRLGLGIYGLYPSEATKSGLDLRLAVSLTSKIVGINHCKAGETISYGRNYVVEKESQNIAVVPVGYFDGIHRNYSGKGSVIVRGMKAPMIGTICMDFMMVVISDIPDAAVGDSVLIFGEDEYGNYLSPEELAKSGNSIIYELLTCLGPRIQRIFVYEEAKQLR